MIDSLDFFKNEVPSFQLDSFLELGQTYSCSCGSPGQIFVLWRVPKDSKFSGKLIRGNVPHMDCAWLPGGIVSHFY